MPNVTELIRTAIALAGSEAKLGAAAGVSQHAIWYAKKHGRITAELATAVDKATNGQVSKAMLRPDLFGADA